MSIGRLLAGVVLALALLFVIAGYTAERKQKDAFGEIMNIPVTRTKVFPGEVVTGKMILLKKLPEKCLAPGTLRKAEEIIGKRASRIMGKGEPFTELSLMSNPISSKIPKGLRAYPLEITQGRATWGVSVGDRVDILATREDENTVTVLKERIVLSKGSESCAAGNARADGGPSVVFLLVTQEEAEILARASLNSSISITLCPPSSAIE